MIYHYTNIETLALILANRTIRFNRLDLVDDPEEFDFEHEGLRPAEYYFISCWTNNERESLPQWAMYGHSNHGVRIGMKENMFTVYEVNGRHSYYHDIINKEINCIILPIEPSNCNSSLHSIEYVKKPQSFYENIAGYHNNQPMINFNQLGLYKSEEWAFQQECRFSLTIIPTLINGERIAPLTYALENHIKLNFTHFDLKIKPDAYDEMDILLGPSVNAAQRIIIKSLMKQYLGRDNSSDSIFTGKTRI